MSEPAPPGPRVHGLVLAAGAGRRYGGPKALARHPDGAPWLETAVAALRGDDPDRPVTVVLGAEAEAARRLVPVGAAVVVAPDWSRGMAASLAAGLGAVAVDADAVLVTLVDLPDVGASVTARLLAAVIPRPPVAATPASQGPRSGVRATLVRASYAGRPGHPVLLGADHLADVRVAARGDRGARDYLAEHGCDLVECGDLATGRDVDER